MTIPLSITCLCNTREDALRQAKDVFFFENLVAKRKHSSVKLITLWHIGESLTVLEVHTLKCLIAKSLAPCAKKFACHCKISYYNKQFNSHVFNQISF
jgi:hypothetical protein